MRKTTLLRMIAIAVLITSWVGISALGTWLIGSHLPFQGAFLYFLLFLCTLIVSGILLFRGLMWFFPLQLGEIPIGSQQEFVFQVFYDPLIYFLLYPLAFSGLIPLPLTRLLYKLWGAQIGEWTYPGRCMIFDPMFVTVGKMVIMGFNSSLIPHIMEGQRLAHARIIVGDHATIGTNAVILAGTTIGEGAVVAAGAIVPKHTRIGPNEIWAGVPARCIGFTEKKRAISPVDIFETIQGGGHTPVPQPHRHTDGLTLESERSKFAGSSCRVVGGRPSAPR